MRDIQSNDNIDSFYRRRGLVMRILSVCLSVKRVICDKMEERSV